MAIDTADFIYDLLILEGLKFLWTGLMLLALYQSACGMRSHAYHMTIM